MTDSYIVRTLIAIAERDDHGRRIRLTPKEGLAARSLLRRLELAERAEARNAIIVRAQKQRATRRPNRPSRGESR